MPNHPSAGEKAPATTSSASPTRTLSDRLTLKDIAAYVADYALRRGRTYQQQHRVTGLSGNADLSAITARVQGSRDEPYHVSIALSLTPDSRVRISGACTCPMAHNCKHVAAVLLQLLDQKTPAQGALALDDPTADTLAEDTLAGGEPSARSFAELEPKPANNAPALSLPFEISAWLDQLSQSANGDVYPPGVTQRILYLVTSVPTQHGTPHLAVDIMSARISRSGEFSSLTRPLLSTFQNSSWPRYFRSSDIQICQSLQATRNTSLSYTLSSFETLKAIVETGRAFWKHQDQAPLSLGEPRPGEIQWTMPNTRGMRPVLNVPGAETLNAEPPVYIDTKENVIGVIDLPLAAALAHRLLHAPPIAPAHVAQVSQSLARYLPADSDYLPKPPAKPVIETAAPKPSLRLLVHRGGPNDGYTPYEMPLARLTFHYGAVPVSLGETLPTVEAMVGNRRYQARRSPAWEKEKLARLLALDFRFAPDIYALLDPEFHHDLAFADSYSWLQFLSQDREALTAAGFQITVDDDFPYRLAVPLGEIETEVFPGNRIDWFELGMGVQVDGQKLDLAPILADLVLTDQLDPSTVTALAADNEDIYIPLDDGRHLALAARRFLPVIIALHELTMGGAVIAKNGRVQISKAETALLSVLENQAGVAFTGMESLRRLARAYSSPAAASVPPVTLPASFQATLRPYQTEGLAWLNLLRDVGLGGILADDMGLGKTVQILALLALEKAEGRLLDPALIIAPTSLMTNWQNEARKFTPGLRVLLLHGADRKDRFGHIAGHDIVLTTYPLIARDQAVLLERQWHMAILDEAQVIKNPNAATTKVIRDIKCAHRFCLTGTPMENHLGELWSLMSFVNPGYLGDKTTFARRWRTPIEKHADKERSQTLARRVHPFLLRRTKAAVAGELPPKTEITEPIVLDQQQRDVYDSIRLSMHKKVRSAIAAKGLAKSHIIILEALLKLRQVCCDPRLLRLTTGRPAPSAKLGRLLEMLQELLAEGRKILVFSQFTSMLALMTERIEAAGFRYSLLTGETLDRKTAIDAFQNGHVNLFLVSLKAGGVGLNLTAADTVILYDPWWNPAVEEQAIDRAYRIGQDKPVFVYRLVAAGTIEEKMDELKAKKRALASSIFDTAGQPGAALTESDLDSLFDA